MPGFESSNGEPPRLALACGGIGSPRPEVLAAIATSFEHPLDTVHQAPDALLMCDREPRRWAAGGEHGLTWGRALPPPGTPSGWEDAALRGDAGLVFGPEGPRLHSSTSGAVPIHWLAHEGAVYFASLLDPLARGAPIPLSIDWEAWAGLFGTGCVLVPRTQFREIRRLPPHATLAVRHAAPIVAAPEWPWLRIEPDRDVETSAGPALEALRAVARRLPERPIPIPLSGGLDSRLLAVLVVERGPAGTAYTVNGDSGNDSEPRAASAVAGALGLEHEIVAGDGDGWWPDALQRGVRSDFMRTVNPWLEPAHRRLGELGAPVLDGLGGDVTTDRSRYMKRAMFDPATPRLAAPLWQAMRPERGVPLAGALGDAFADSAREQVRAVCTPLNGHPNRGVFGVYLSRMIGGVSRVSLGSLGTRALVEAPYVTDEVAQHTLAVAPASKYERSLRRAMLELASPKLAALPTNHDNTIGAVRVPRRRASEATLRGYAELLADGPLAPYLPDAARALLAGEPFERRPRRVWRVIDSVASVHLWLRRYGDLVSGTDPASFP